MMSEDDDLRVRRVLMLLDHNILLNGDDDPEHPMFTVDGRPATDDEAQVLAGLTMADLHDVEGHLVLGAHLRDMEVWGQVLDAVRTELRRTRDFLATLDDPPAPSA